MTRSVSLSATVCVALLSAGCGGGGSGPKDGPVEAGKPAFSLSSGDFFADYQKNMTDARKKYSGKVVELTGKLVAISNDPQKGKAQFWLEGPDPAKNSWALCMMTERYPWKNANPRQTVKIKGKGSEIGAPELTECVLVEVSGDPAPRLTAEQLAREQTEGTAAKKYQKKYLVITGEIEKFDDINSALVFKTEGKTKVSAHFNPDERKRINSWKPGQKVELIGLSNIIEGSPSVMIANSLPMDDAK
jgi:hypothetical protein